MILRFLPLSYFNFHYNLKWLFNTPINCTTSILLIVVIFRIRRLLIERRRGKLRIGETPVAATGESIQNDCLILLNTRSILNKPDIIKLFSANSFNPSFIVGLKSFKRANTNVNHNTTLWLEILIWKLEDKIQNWRISIGEYENETFPPCCVVLYILYTLHSATCFALVLPLEKRLLPNCIRGDWATNPRFLHFPLNRLGNARRSEMRIPFTSPLSTVAQRGW